MAVTGVTNDRWFDRFSGKLVLVLLDNKYAPSVRDGRSLWALYETLSYVPGDRTTTITVPKGFVTDLASIPRWFWVLLPPDGPWVKAAIIHDFLYSTSGDGKAWDHESTIVPNRTYSRDEADEILREAMENRGVDWFRRTVIYLAVHLFGGPGWGRPKKIKPDPQEVEAAIGGPVS